MPDKTYAKFILNNETYLDLTSDTVDSSSLLSGYTAHDRSGAPITGSFDPSVYVLKAGDTMTGTLNLPTLNLTGTVEEDYENETTVILNKISLSKICTDDTISTLPYPLKLVSTIDNGETIWTNYYGNIARNDLAKRSGVHFNSKIIADADEEHDPPAWERYLESDIFLGNEYFNNIFTDSVGGLEPFVRPRFNLEYTNPYDNVYNTEYEEIDEDGYTYTQKDSYFHKLSYPYFGDAGYTDFGLEHYDKGSLCISSGTKTEYYNSTYPENENKHFTNYGNTEITSISPNGIKVFGLDSNGRQHFSISIGNRGSVTSPNGYITINSTDIRFGIPFLYKIWPDNDVSGIANYSISANQSLTSSNLINLRTYTCDSSSIVSTLSNKPSGLTKPFIMYNYSPSLTSYDTPTTGSDTCYITRKIIDSDGNEWNQAVTGTYGSKTFGSWKKRANIDDLNSYISKSGGTITGGYLIITDNHMESGSASGYLSLGNDIDYTSPGSSFGMLHLYDANTYKVSVRTTTLSEDRLLYLPNKSGTIAITDDLNSYVLKSGDSMTGALSFYDGSTLKSKISNTELQVNGHDLLRMTPHFAQTFATEIPANSNLNTTTYLKVGQYYCVTTYGFSNSPTGNQFVMEVTAMIYNRYDDESGTADAYRIRKITDYVGNQFIQYCSKATNGIWNYGAWQLYIVGSKVGTLANASGTSLAESYCQQYGRTVNIRVWLTGLSTSVQTHENVITVGAVDMPTTPIRFVFTCWIGNNIAAYAGYGTMATNGKITLVKAVTNSDKASFNITYNV